ncbi:hypothetical protein IAE19_03635 [Acinetobacter sp. S40]|uniref:hypothetical protein n=1 Tax=unclassified Acinetobacter TaxID=196816 RepID=UPI00190C92A6|nr:MULTISPECIES: hypothetical protein [unclassified Acinetobacter]MBJ9984530.1 hypothetical protein [Acinetobacter sp. S40]MBK0062247.1 hypothetical protein [Acinetobacter sp. S55]MBK0066051.1 hypothetical protein [Acinetobacter sp. S54]
MTGQQRSILATMGVDVWIPRAVSCHKKQAVSLWRDQIPSKSQESSQVVSQQLATVGSEPQLAKTIESIPAQIVPTVEIALQDIESPTAISLPLEQPKVVLMQQAFTLEAYCLDQVILVIESSQLSKEQRQLWANIQASLPGFYNELKWPLPLENFRDGRGVHAYVQGFLDALAIDKRVLVLGQLDFISHVQSMQISSLQEMIDQPLLKRRLWQLMLSP